jgi:hypothetical protein
MIKTFLVIMLISQPIPGDDSGFQQLERDQVDQSVFEILPVRADLPNATEVEDERMVAGSSIVAITSPTGRIYKRLVSKGPPPVWEDWPNIPATPTPQAIVEATDTDNILQIRENPNEKILYVPRPVINASTQEHNRVIIDEHGKFTTINVPGVKTIFNASGAIAITTSERTVANEEILEVTLEVASQGDSVVQPTPTPRFTQIDEELGGNYTPGNSSFTTSYPILNDQIEVMLQRDSSGSISHPLPLVRGSGYTVTATNEITLNFPLKFADKVGRVLEPRLRGIYETMGY